MQTESLWLTRDIFGRNNNTRHSLSLQNWKEKKKMTEPTIVEILYCKDGFECMFDCHLETFLGTFNAFQTSGTAFNKWVISCYFSLNASMDLYALLQVIWNDLHTEESIFEIFNPFVYSLYKFSFCSFSFFCQLFDHLSGDYRFLNLAMLINLKKVILSDQLSCVY